MFFQRIQIIASMQSSFANVSFLLHFLLPFLENTLKNSKNGTKMFWNTKNDSSILQVNSSYMDNNGIYTISLKHF